MIRFLADEDFNGRIFRGLKLRSQDLDLVRVQDVGLQGSDDATLLIWADNNGRILLTHDARTMPKHVRDRLAAGFHIPGVLVVDDLAPIGTCIEEIELVAECSEISDWRDEICYLPFR
jgi:hypothetical protein